MYGGYVLHLEFAREVPTVHMGNRVLWLVVLLYDISISFIMGLVDDPEEVNINQSEFVLCRNSPCLQGDVQLGDSCC